VCNVGRILFLLIHNDITFLFQFLFISINLHVPTPKITKRFLRFRWWLAVTMEPRREDASMPLDDPRSLAQGFFHLEPRCEEDDSPMRILLTTPRSPAQAQYVFECLSLLPTLQYDSYLSYSAVVNRHFSGELEEDHHPHHNLFRQRSAAAAAALHYMMSL
jgi:hypothetical protein